MKAVIESIGKVGSRARFAGHELVFDQPPNVPGGEDRGPSPLDVMSVSVLTHEAHTSFRCIAGGSGRFRSGTPVCQSNKVDRSPHKACS